MNKKVKDFLIVVAVSGLLGGISEGIKTYQRKKREKEIEAINKMLDDIPSEFSRIEGKFERPKEGIINISDRLCYDPNTGSYYIRASWIYDPRLDEHEQMQRFEEFMNEGVGLYFD